MEVEKSPPVSLWGGGRQLARLAPRVALKVPPPRPPDPWIAGFLFDFLLDSSSILAGVGGPRQIDAENAAGGAAAAPRSLECWIPTGFLLDSCRVPVGFLFDSSKGPCWIPVGFL